MQRNLHRSPWLSAPARLVAGLSVSLPLALLLPHHLGPEVRLLAGWDSFAAMFLTLTWYAVWRLTPAEARSAAEAVDVSHRSALFLVLTAAIISFFSAVLILRGLPKQSPALVTLVSLLGLAAIMLSWLLTHTVYGLHYLHMYYGTGHRSSGLNFPGGEPPDAIDFQYFSFTVGMTFQVSDVAITSRYLRRVMLRHALLSFAFATVIIAMTINLIASRL
jgi:uncharacterized membrane protein